MKNEELRIFEFNTINFTNFKNFWTFNWVYCVAKIQVKVKSDALNVVEVLKKADASIASQSSQAHSAHSDLVESIVLPLRAKLLRV